MNGKKARQFHRMLRTSYEQLKHRLGANSDLNKLPVQIYKKYQRAPQIKLPKSTEISIDLTAAIISRYTAANFSLTEISLQDLANLVDVSVGLRDRNTNSKFRHHPSGGGLYPIELYLLIESDVVSDVESGLFHYNVLDHTLEQIGGKPEMLEAKAAMNINREVPIICMLSACWERNMQKYDDFGYKIVLLEAGHIAQNLILTARGIGLQSWPFVHFNEKELNVALDLEMRNEEDVIYCIGLGKPAN